MSLARADRPAVLPTSVKVLERGWVSSNNIVLMGRDDTAVVDTGYATHAPQTVALVGTVLEGRPLDRIFNTHAHSDHIGGNAALQRAYPGARLAIPEGDVSVISEWNEAVLHLAPQGQQCERFGFDATFAAGDSVTLGDMAWCFVASPGHHMTSHVLYAEEARLLISADALWEDGFGVLFPHFDDTGVTRADAFAAQRATLEAIAALDIGLVIPGHGAPFTAVEPAIERALGRLAYFQAHPERHARNGLKVGLSFLLMIEERLPLATLPQRLAAIPLLGQINAAFYQLAPEALASLVVAELEKSGAAHCADGWLISGPTRP